MPKLVCVRDQAPLVPEIVGCCQLPTAEPPLKAAGLSESQGKTLLQGRPKGRVTQASRGYSRLQAARGVGDLQGRVGAHYWSCMGYRGTTYRWRVLVLDGRGGC